MRNFRLLAALAFTIASLASCGTRKDARVTAPVAIAYGGAVGSSRTWEMRQAFKGKIMSGGMPQLVVVHAHATIREQVEELGDNGWRKVRLATRMSPLEMNGMVLEMGSLPPSVETVAMRSPSGDIKEMEKPPDGSDVLAWVARSLGSTFPMLPPAPVFPGEKWERRSETNAPSGGVFESVTIGVFDGMENVGGVRCARLLMDGGVNLSGASKGAELDVFAMEYRGVVRFDVAGGSVVDSIQKGSLKVKGRMGKAPVEAMMLFESSLKPAVGK